MVCTETTTDHLVAGSQFPWPEPEKPSIRKSDFSDFSWVWVSQWIGLRENLQETMVFTIKYRGFL
jgi:hypothetical protein